MTQLVAPHVLHVSEYESPSPELLALRRAATDGHPVGVVVVPSEFEENLYRLNNLPVLLRQLFVELDPADPDEDILEEFEHDAIRLVKGAVLLEEAVDAFYEALEGADFPLTVRRSDQGAFTEVTNRRAALLQTKQLYAQEWSYSSFENRLKKTQSIAISPGHVFLHSAERAAEPGIVRALQQKQPDANISAVRTDSSGRIVRIIRG